ncbi:MAG TPA: hypothetical protein VKE94_15645 [Gemmataceae bacterium]|nr:hypothetical protein [Gemmataceae bacterium]
MSRRVPILFLSALVSAVLFVTVVVRWVRASPPSGSIGVAALRESTETGMLMDAFNVQLLGASLWVGSTRTTVLAPHGLWGEREEFERIASNPDVARAIENLPPQPKALAGFARVSGTAAMDGPVFVELSGVIVPGWFLAVITAVLPAAWIGRALRSLRKRRARISQ